MDCRDFEDRLDIFQAGLLPSDEQAEASEHVCACPRCRALLAIVRGESDILAPEAGADLAFSILRKTSGSVCRTAEERICDALDGTLGTEDREILSLHLVHCRSCSRLAEILRELSQVLPEMAMLEPDAQFTGDVLRATCSPRRIRPEPYLQSWWNRLIRRPRFAWEAAYVGSLLLLLALGNPAMLPSASAVPQMLAEQSDRLLQGTAGVLMDQQVAAARSLSDLGLKGKVMLDKADGLRVQTTTALQRELVSWLDQLKSGFFDLVPAEQSKKGLQ